MHDRKIDQLAPQPAVFYFSTIIAAPIFSLPYYPPTATLHLLTSIWHITKQQTTKSAQENAHFAQGMNKNTAHLSIAKDDNRQTTNHFILLYPV